MLDDSEILLNCTAGTASAAGIAGIAVVTFHILSLNEVDSGAGLTAWRKWTGVERRMSQIEQKRQNVVYRLNIRRFFSVVVVTSRKRVWIFYFGEKFLIGAKG